jgi:hypothetical protein
MQRLAGLIPDAAGYREQGDRAATDELFRGHVAEELETLRVRMAELKTAADDEGEEDMLDDLDRIDIRMERTIEALRAAAQNAAFFSGAVEDGHLERVCAYDLTILEDVALLVRDTMGLKYETIGNLTLREIEGTLAAIELKITNRADVLADTGRN